VAVEGGEGGRGVGEGVDEKGGGTEWEKRRGREEGVWVRGGGIKPTSNNKRFY